MSQCTDYGRITTRTPNLIIVPVKLFPGKDSKHLLAGQIARSEVRSVRIRERHRPMDCRTARRVAAGERSEPSVLQ